MSEECTHDCSSCGANCPSRNGQPESLIEAPHALSRINNVIAVVSGKGGVGKTMVTTLLSVLMQRRGFGAAVLDADITGPSVPRALGTTRPAEGDENGIYPVLSKTGIQTISINNLLPDETDPVVWRGPVIAGTVKQFWTDVIWNDVDYMFIDMPPGTGDVPLTVFQSIPIKGIIVVTSPQELVGVIVEKAVKMAGLMDVPVLGIVENMSYYECPKCGEHLPVFGESHVEEIASRYGIPTVARLPIHPKLAAAADKGMIELFEGNWLDGMADAIEAASLPE